MELVSSPHETMTIPSNALHLLLLPLSATADSREAPSSKLIAQSYEEAAKREPTTDYRLPTTDHRLLFFFERPIPRHEDIFEEIDRKIVGEAGNIIDGCYRDIPFRQAELFCRKPFFVEISFVVLLCVVRE